MNKPEKGLKVQTFSTKSDTHLRTPWISEEELTVTLGYLATKETTEGLMFQFWVYKGKLFTMAYTQIIR